MAEGIEIWVAMLLTACCASCHAESSEATAGAGPVATAGGRLTSPRLAAPLVHSPDIRLSSSHTESGRIACGSGSCDASTSYCEVIQSDVLELPSDFTCQPLPRACSESKDCSCFPRGTRCSDFCSASRGAFRLTCVGGR